jgi:hypothetical protein
MESTSPIADSPELRTVKKCTPDLEKALVGLERGLVYFMNQQGFFIDDVAKKILNPVSMLSDIEKSGELTGWIVHRVEQDPNSYHVLLDKLKNSGGHYEPVAKILEAEFLKQGCTGGCFI